MNYLSPVLNWNLKKVIHFPPLCVCVCVLSGVGEAGAERGVGWSGDYLVPTVSRFCVFWNVKYQTETQPFIYPAEKETRKFVILKLIKNKIC